MKTLKRGRSLKKLHHVKFSIQKKDCTNNKTHFQAHVHSINQNLKISLSTYGFLHKLQDKKNVP